MQGPHSPASISCRVDFCFYPHSPIVAIANILTNSFKSTFELVIWKHLSVLGMPATLTSTYRINARQRPTWNFLDCGPLPGWAIFPLFQRSHPHPGDQSSLFQFHRKIRKLHRKIRKPWGKSTFRRHKPFYVQGFFYLMPITWFPLSKPLRQGWTRVPLHSGCSTSKYKETWRSAQQTCS